MTRTERSYYVLFGFYTQWSWFMAPVYPLFLLSLGLDLFQVNVVLAIFLTGTFLFEVPTGVVADIFGRKASFLLSCAVRTCAFFVYARAETFTDCVVAELMDAIGTTLASGALDAWAVDGMKEEGNRTPSDRFFARAQMLSRVVMVVGGVVSGYVAEVSFRIGWMIGGTGFALLGIFALFTMKETPRRTAIAVEHGSQFIAAVRQGWGIARHSRELLILCLLSGALVSASIPTHMLWQTRLQAFAGEGVSLMGWVWALMNLTALSGSYVMALLSSRYQRESLLFFAALWRGGTLLLAALATTFTPILAGILLQEAAFGLSEPIFLASINDRIGPELRATVMSVRSMFVTLGGSLGLVALGLVARSQGIPTAWVIAAMMLFAIAPCFLLLRARGDAGSLDTAVPGR
jgi:MFS family permease